MHETLRKLREHNNYSQSGIAQLLNISRQMYVKYENGEVDPPVRIIKQLCSLYKVSYSFLIDDALAKKDPEQRSNNISYDTLTPDFDVSIAAAPITDSTNYMSHRKHSPQSFEAVIEAIRSLSSDQFTAILAFIRYLQDHTDSGQQKSIIPPRAPKEAFFNLAGKIELSTEEIASFREDSLI